MLRGIGAWIFGLFIFHLSFAIWLSLESEVKLGAHTRIKWKMTNGK
jgi:hypothetical protein